MAGCRSPNQNGGFEPAGRALVPVQREMERWCWLSIRGWKPLGSSPRLASGLGIAIVLRARKDEVPAKLNLYNFAHNYTIFMIKFDQIMRLEFDIQVLGQKLKPYGRRSPDSGNVVIAMKAENENGVEHTVLLVVQDLRVLILGQLVLSAKGNRVVLARDAQDVSKGDHRPHRGKSVGAELGSSRRDGAPPESEIICKETTP